MTRPLRRKCFAGLLLALCVPHGASAFLLGARGHVAAKALFANTTILTAQVPEVEKELHAAATSATQEQVTAMQVAAANLTAISGGELASQVVSAKSTRQQKLDNINLAAEMSLRTAKSALEDARRAGADKARATAAMQAAVVQRAAEQDIFSLMNMAKQLEVEAQQRTSDAMEASSATDAAAIAAAGWRNKWPSAELQSAIQLSEAANGTAVRMRDLAASAERVAALVDDAAEGTRGIVEETLRRARNADVLARTAVDQAAQNSLKLKAIRNLVVETEDSAMAVPNAALVL